MLSHLHRLPIEVIQNFLKKRDAKACGVPPALAEYILQLNDAYNLNKRHRAIGECANQLMLRYPELSLPTCKSRVHDAISFFNQGCSVTADAWDSYFADRMAMLFEINLVAQDRKEARVCSEKEHALRISASKNRIDPRRLQFKHQIVSPDVHLPRMGVTPVGMLRAWEEAKKIIKSRDISQSEQERLLMEAARELDIKEGYTDYEEIEG